MAKSKVSSKDTPRQEPITNAVVNWSTFDDFYNRVTVFNEHIEFLARSGLQTGPFDMALGLIMDQTEEMKNLLSEYLERMRDKESPETATQADERLILGKGETMSVQMVSNKYFGDVDYPLERIQRISRSMMMLNIDDFEQTESNDLYYDFFLIINKNAKEARKILKEIENGNKT